MDENGFLKAKDEVRRAQVNMEVLRKQKESALAKVNEKFGVKDAESALKEINKINAELETLKNHRDELMEKFEAGLNEYRSAIN